ncbi:MAG: TolC family protein [Bacteroidetes bacterium]|nr:MAG: TolC family protein [Bacteroidota bacterium]
MLQLIVALGFLIASVFSCSTSSKAQDNKPTGGVWSLEDCIQYGTKNSINVQQADIQMQLSNANLQQSKFARYPNLNANASQALNWGRSIDPFSNTFVTQQVNSNNFSVSSSVTLFNGYRLQNTIRQNINSVEVNRLNIEQAKQTLALNIAVAYLNVLQNQELLRTTQTNILSTQAQLERTQKLFDAGAVAEIDVINLKSTIATNQLAITNAQNALTSAKVLLQQQMNYPIEGDFQVKTVNVDNLTVNDLVETPTQIYQTAEGSQASVKSADQTVKGNDIGIELAKSGLYPTLTLNGVLFSGYSSATPKFESEVTVADRTIGIVQGTNQPVIVPNAVSVTRNEVPYQFFPQVGDNFRQQVSLQLNIPIFNGKQARTQIGNAVLTKKNSELQAKQVRQQLRQTIEQAYIDAKNAYQTYQTRQEQVKALVNSFEVTDKRYQAGASNVVDYNLAKNNVENAKIDLVRSKYEYLFRKKVLDFYMNKPLTMD